MAYRSSTTASGTNGSPTTNNVAVPAGVAANDIVLLMVSLDNQTHAWAPTDWPSGFTELSDVDLTVDGHSCGLAWKRATGADTGNYGVTNSSGDWVIFAVVFSGRDTTNPPTISTNTDNTSRATPVTANANTVTALTGDDLLWICCPDPNTGNNVYSGGTVPATFTERQDTAGGWANMFAGTKDNVSAGATGTVAGSFTMTSGTPRAAYNAWLVRIPATGGGGTSQALAGTTAGTSTTTGAVAVAHPIAGSSAGASTTTGAVAVAHPLDGTSAGSSTTTGALTVTTLQTLSGTSGGASATTGALTVSHSLAGTSAGTSGSTGALGLACACAGTTAGTSATTGALSASYVLAGTSAGTSTSTGNLSVTAAGITALGGVTPGTSTTVGALTLTLGLQAMSSSAGVTTGTLTVTSPGITALEAMSSGDSADTGQLTGQWALASLSAGHSTTTGHLTTSGLETGEPPNLRLTVTTNQLTLTATGRRLQLATTRQPDLELTLS